VRALRWRYRRAYRALPSSAPSLPRYAWRALARPAVAAKETLRAVQELGARAEAAGGVGRVRQAIDLWWARTVHGIEPNLYYAMRLFEPERRTLAARVLRHRESRRLLRLIVADARGRAPGDVDVFDDKRAFHVWACEHGLPTPPLVLVVVGGVVVEGDATTLPAHDLFSKPTNGTSGQGTRRWRYDPASRTYAAPSSRGGAPHSAEELVAALAEQSLERRVQRYGIVVQPALTVHPAVSGLTSGALATVRLITLRWPDGRVETLFGIYRMPVGEVDADNFDLGGLAAPVDLATGRLQPAISKDPSRLSAPILVHPATGARFVGTILPDWDDALTLARRAHEQSPVPYPVLGWDVALTPDGPSLIEGNCSPGATMPQVATGTPLGETGWASCLLAYLEDIPRAWASMSTRATGLTRDHVSC
jgi:hypothetical protein